MQWADDVRIETPEQIDVSLEVAGLGSRFMAQVIDWAIKVGGALVLVVVAALFLALLGIALHERAVLTYLGAIGGAILYFLFLTYDVYFEVRHDGRTPGKKVAGIRVIRENGSPVDVRSACIRFFLAFADFLPIFHLLGGLLVLVSARGQRLGDMAAGTLVIRERCREKPVDPTKEVERLVSDEFTFSGEQLAACTPNDRNVLRSFFQRYHELQPRPRQLLALRLADEFTRKTDYQQPHGFLDWPTAESFLATLYRDLEARARMG